MSTRLYINPASLLFVVALIGGCCFVYYKVEQAKTERIKEEARLLVELEKQRKLEAEREAARIQAEREEAEKRRQADFERERMRQETERLRLLADAEQRAKASEEQRKREEAERIAREEAEKRRQEQEEAERRRREAEDAAARLGSIDEARKSLKTASAEAGRLEGLCAEKRRQIAACKTRIEGATKTQTLAQKEAVEWARKQGVIIEGRDFSWDMFYGGANSGGVTMVQDNSEQIAKCKNKYDAAQKEIDQCQEAANKAEAELAQAQSQLDAAKATAQRARDYLKQQGAEVAEAPVPGEKSAFRVFVLKDGKRIEAKRAMEIDDTWALQDPGGKTHSIKKTEVAEIVNP